MSIVRLVVAFFLGALCAFFAVSVMSSAPGQFNSGDIVVTAVALILAIAFFSGSTSSASRRVYVFTAAAVFLIGIGLFLLLITDSPISPEVAKSTGISAQDLIAVSAGQAQLRLQGLYSIPVGVVFALVGAGLYWLGNRKAR